MNRVYLFRNCIMPLLIKTIQFFGAVSPNYHYHSPGVPWLMSAWTDDLGGGGGVQRFLWLKLSKFPATAKQCKLVNNIVFYLQK